MNAMIAGAVPADLSEIRAYRVENSVQSVSCREKSVLPAVGEEKYRVALEGATGKVTTIAVNGEASSLPKPDPNAPPPWSSSAMRS